CGLGGRRGEDGETLVGPAGDEKDGFRPYVGVNTRLVAAPGHRARPRTWAGRKLRQVRKPLGKVWRKARGMIIPPAEIRPRPKPLSSGFYESLTPNVLHITYPLHFICCDVPTVFTIHDLQHRHLPEFFSEEHLEWREMLYPLAFQESRAIVTIAKWVTVDLMQQYGVPREKIYTIPHAA